MARRLYERSQLDETFHGGWRREAEIFYRQRRSIWLVLAVLVTMSAFWTNQWAWVFFFAALALYSAWVGVRIGVLCGLSFCIWIGVGLEGWLSPGSTGYRALGLWAIATLFLLVVWKADGKTEMRKRDAA